MLRRLKELDQRFARRMRPDPEETREAFLARVGNDGLPYLGYASPLRPLLWELTREVTALRSEVEALKRARE